MPALDSMVDYVKAGKESYRIVSDFDQFEYRSEAPLFRRLSESFKVRVYGLNLVQVVICWEDGKGGRRRLQARAVNVSPSGVLLEVEGHVAVGTAVILQTSNFVVLGKACVRHCQPKGLRYTLGFYVPGRLPRTF